jgi:hypothetical protein
VVHFPPILRVAALRFKKEEQMSVSVAARANDVTLIKRKACLRSARVAASGEWRVISSYKNFLRTKNCRFDTAEWSIRAFPSLRA